jgi:hypothetical protein
MPVDDPRFFKSVSAFAGFGLQLITDDLLPEASEIRQVLTRFVAREDPLAQAVTLQLTITSHPEIPPMADPVTDTMHGSENVRSYTISPLNEEGQVTPLTSVTWSGGRDASNNPIVVLEPDPANPTGTFARRIKGVLGDCTLTATGTNADGSVLVQVVNLTVAALDASSLNVQANSVPADQQGAEAAPAAAPVAPTA